MYRAFIVSALVGFFMATVVSADTSVKIVNGDNANIEDYPWMVSIQFRINENDSFTHKCGGAILDKSWILTAAHCNIDNPGRPANDIRIQAGSSFFESDESKNTSEKVLRDMILNGWERSESNQDALHLAQTKFHWQTLSMRSFTCEFKNITTHEQFKPFVTGQLDNDLMLLQLRKPLRFGSTINKIDLDTEIGKNYTGELCTITGWGDTDVNAGGNMPDRLQVLNLPVVTNEHCGIAWRIPQTFWNNMICLQDKDKDSCRGDSGGPVICNNKLVGTLSYGNNSPCDGSYPSVHSRISAYLDWIKGKMNAKNKKDKKNKKGLSNTKGKGKKKQKNNKN